MLAETSSTAMLELFQESLLPVNLPFTILLGLIAIYWVIGLLGLIDIDGPDGVEAGVEVDVEVDGGDDGGSASGGLYKTLLNVIGASDAPLMFVISLFSLFLWASNVLLNHYFNPDFETGRASLLLIPVVVGSFVLTRLLVIPLRPVMKMLRSPEKPVEVIGASGIVRSSKIDSEFGEVEVSASERNLILRARISTNEAPLVKGDRILVVSKEDESDTYVVRALPN